MGSNSNLLQIRIWKEICKEKRGAATPPVFLGYNLIAQSLKILLRQPCQKVTAAIWRHLMNKFIVLPFRVFAPVGLTINYSQTLEESFVNKCFKPSLAGRFEQDAKIRLLS